MATQEELIEQSKRLATMCIGYETESAQRLAATNGRFARVVSEDGILYYGDDFYQPNRINLTVIDGKVVDSTVG